MTFRELYEAEAEVNQTTSKEPPKEAPKEKNPQQATTPGTIDDVIKAINDINNANKLVDFFRRVTRASNTSINIKVGDNKVTTIKLKKDDKLIAPTEDFDKFANAVKKTYSSWEEQLLANKDKFAKNDTSSNSKTTADYIATTLIPLIKKPSAPIGKDGKILNNNATRSGNTEYGHENDYHKFGQAMVFFSAKCCSKLTDINTEIDQKKFDHIMQGVFGESGGKQENDSFLTQFITIRPKMKIDAAKAVIESKSGNIKNDQGYQGSINNSQANEQMDDSFKDMSYYERISFMLKLNEAEDATVGSAGAPEGGDSGNNGNNGKNSSGSAASKGAYPKTVGDFSELAEVALKQAEMVEKKHPKEFKIQFDKLEAAFNAGVKEYQDKFKRDKFDGTIENPLTGHTEKVGARSVNAFLSGPNRFRRDNPILDNLCKDIEGQKWDIFNAPAKLLLKLFDIMEKGGNILQKFIDDVDDALKGLHQYFDRVKPDKFREMIKTAINDGNYKEAESLSIASSMIFMANLFNTLANGPYGIINTTKHSFTTAEKNGEVPMRTVAKRAEEALQMTIQTGEGFAKWKAEKDKENEKKIKELEEKIKNKEASENGGNTGAEGTEKKDGAAPSSNDSTPPAENSSYKPRSFLSFLNEEESSGNGNTEGEEESSLDTLKKQLEELQNKVDEETSIDLTRFATVLDEFKKTSAERNEIKNNVLPWFKKIYAENEADANEFIEQYSGVSAENSEAGVEAEDTEKQRESVTIKNIVLKPIILEVSEENDDDFAPSTEDSPNSSSTSSTNPDNKDDKSGKEGQDGQEGKEEQSNQGEPEGTWQDEAAKSHAAMISLLTAAAESKLDEGTIRTISEKLRKSETVLEGIKMFKDMLKEFLPMLERAEDIVPFKGFVVKTTDDMAKDLEAVGFEVHTETQKVEKDNDGENNTNAEMNQEFFNKCDETIKSTIGKELSTILESMETTLDKAHDDSWIGEYETLNKNLNKTVDDFKKYLSDVLFVAANSDAGDDQEKLNAKEKATELRDAYIKSWDAFMNTDPAFLPKLYYFLNMYNKIRKVIDNGKKAQTHESFYNNAKNMLVENDQPNQEQSNTPAGNTEQSGTSTAGGNNGQQASGNNDDGNGLKYVSGAYLKAALVENSSEVYKLFFNTVMPKKIDHDWYQRCVESDGKNGWQEPWNKHQRQYGDTTLGLTSENEELKPAAAVRQICDITSNNCSKTVKANYKSANMAKSIEYIVSSTKDRKKWDLFAYICALRACASVVVKLLESKGRDYNETITMQFGIAANKATNDHQRETGEKMHQNAIKNKEEEVNKPVSGTVKDDSSSAPSQNTSYIPEYSPDTLINEIYKYIR